MAFAGLAEVIYNQKIGPGLYLMRVLARDLARSAHPGQFVHVRCGSTGDPLLRRPISLHGIDYDKGTVSLLYQVVGRGTQLLAEMQPGRPIDIMGPLGRGFSIPEGVKDVLVIGGGIGAAPLFPLVQAIKAKGIDQTVLLGARSASQLIGPDQLASLGVRVETATDDGSRGFHGYAPDLAETFIKRGKPDFYYACGPEPMLKRLLSITNRNGIKGEVSLEAYMGCGVGACLACVCKTVADGEGSVAPQDAAGGQGAAAGGAKADFVYKKVCSDGPVFAASEVIFDD